MSEERKLEPNRRRITDRESLEQIAKAGAGVTKTQITIDGIPLETPDEIDRAATDRVSAFWFAVYVALGLLAMVSSLYFQNYGTLERVLGWITEWIQ